MQLQDYLNTLRRRWRTVAVAVAAFVLLGIALIAFTPPTYTATAELFVAPGSRPGADEALQGSRFYENRVKTYAMIVDSSVVLEPVIEELGLDTTPQALAGQVSASAPLETVLLHVTASDGSAEQAADIANAVALSFERVAPELESISGEANEAVRITIVEPATPPSEPVSPNKRLIVMMSLMLGLAAGFAIAVIREVLDDHVRTEGDLAAITDVPVVGKIPEKERNESLIVGTSGTRAEAFRQLRTNLQYLGISDHPRAMVITSALPGEGKSVTALNLALTIARTGQSVCLVEADLRHPGISPAMHVEHEAGLTSIIVGAAKFDEVVQFWSDTGVDILPSGHLPPNPSELLSNEATESLLEFLQERYDYVVVDAPPLLAVTDAVILAQYCGGAIVVVGNLGRQTVTRRQVTQALDNLTSGGTRALGVVLTRLPTKGPGAVLVTKYHDEPARNPVEAEAVAPDPRPSSTASNTSAANTPAGNTPAGKTPAAKTPAAKTPAAKTPAATSSGATSSAAKTSNGKPDSTNRPAQNASSRNAPSRDRPPRKAADQRASRRRG